MKKAIGTALESDFGFKSPSFSVDALGNVVANSITTTEPIGSGGGEDGSASVSNYIITENDSGTAFQFSGNLIGNPTIELSRGVTYTFSLQLTTLTFYLYNSNGTTIYPNIVDESGATGISANGKSTGTIQITITPNTDDTLVYANEDGTITGQFTIIDPVGVFGGIGITNTTNSTDLGTGALSVAGGASISKDLYLGGDLVLLGTGDVKFDNTTNLTLGAGNRIVYTIDGSFVGEVNENGFETPLVNTTINNTVIGNSVPTTATFTTANVTELPTSVNNVTNKEYVDGQDIALSIALGS
jgi:hypothetical protein